MSTNYDVAIIGSRLSGGTLSMLLARKGLRVVAVDKATFPSSKVPCTHTIPAGCMDTLKRIGLFDLFVKAGADPVRGVDFVYPQGRTHGEIRTNGVPTPGLQLRRLITDNIVVEQAAKAGGELKEGFMVRDLIREDGRVAGFVGENSSGETEEIRARITVVADGRKSSFGNESGFIKRWPCHRFYYYRYFRSAEPVEPVILCWDENPGILCVGPSGEGLMQAMVAPHSREFSAFVSDLENNFTSRLRTVKAIRDILDTAEPIGRVVGRGNLDNTYRDPICNGLILLGDAGLDVDPLAAQGTAWAFISAEILADVLDRCFKENDFSHDSLNEYRTRRDERLLEYFKFFTLWSLARTRTEEDEKFVERCLADPQLTSDLSGLWHMTVKPSAVFPEVRFQTPIESWENENPSTFDLPATAL